jgi:hypothetical protein
MARTSTAQYILPRAVGDVAAGRSDVDSTVMLQVESDLFWWGLHSRRPSVKVGAALRSDGCM